MSIRILTKRLTEEVTEATNRGKMLPILPADPASEPARPKSRIARLDSTTILFGKGQEASAVAMSSIPGDLRHLEAGEAMATTWRPRSEIARWSIPGGIVARFGIRSPGKRVENSELPLDPETGSEDGESKPLDPDYTHSVSNGEKSRNSNGVNGEDSPTIGEFEASIDRESPITIELQSH
ncbi:MAG: hypothetical protein CME25_01490 [Gemmatimonadetes bacterium]|nr:hypothetical protein [Gemmatimonadota bacterium]